MSHENKPKSVIIIGAGFAGLAAGIYAQMNGYKSEIFEMHDQPGGLCTSWKRKGYTIDGCIHWLVGSSPQSAMHDMWEEVGVAQGLDIIDLDEYLRMTWTDGRTVVFYTDVDRLEKHLLELSPQDKEPILSFTRGIRMCIPIEQASKTTPALKRIAARLKVGWTFLTHMKAMKRWMNITTDDFAGRFKDPLLREAFVEMWLPGFSMLFMFFTFAYLHNKNAGYPLGGSMPMSRALERKYQELGGTIHYKQQVEKILTSSDRATGIRLSNGKEHFAEKVISAADGFATLFKMLDGKFGNEETFLPYKAWKPFPALLFVGLGVNRSFEQEPKTVSGVGFRINTSVRVADAEIEWLPVHYYNHDPSLAPEGKTVLTVMLPSDYAFWKNMDRQTYLKQKEEAAQKIVALLEEQYPGLASQVEMIDVATPLTFERYTGNWKGSFEGWLLTPENSLAMMKKMSQQLPGLKNFYMCGQWVEPGGGLPTSIMSAKRLIKTMCKADGKKFKVTL
ncbi:MAG: NAD(P)/FAD-dependent oxidoreductase [Bacteroides sp.]|jgi:phytoene dehydrogenase-like protein|nr:NAD(P)/FAD-dependent oxidoreductase [Bacteroides sp.]